MCEGRGTERVFLVLWCLDWTLGSSGRGVWLSVGEERL